ncbi:hypothetical protein FQN54_002064 [Arachnomyces sp. PD_36]|nr:hypothetical protein FQN54_002064 [Arachnomyces sp. PD_36]
MPPSVSNDPAPGAHQDHAEDSHSTSATHESISDAGDSDIAHSDAGDSEDMEFFATNMPPAPPPTRENSLASRHSASSDQSLEPFPELSPELPELPESPPLLSRLEPYEDHQDRHRYPYYRYDEGIFFEHEADPDSESEYDDSPLLSRGLPPDQREAYFQEVGYVPAQSQSEEPSQSETQSEGQAESQSETEGQAQSQSQNLAQNHSTWVAGEPDREMEELWGSIFPANGHWNVEVIEETDTDIPQEQNSVAITVILTEQNPH